jgi:hypothetical protein
MPLHECTQQSGAGVPDGGPYPQKLLYRRSSVHELRSKDVTVQAMGNVAATQVGRTPVH